MGPPQRGPDWGRQLQRGKAARRADEEGTQRGRRARRNGGATGPSTSKIQYGNARSGWGTGVGALGSGDEEERGHEAWFGLLSRSAVRAADGAQVCQSVPAGVVRSDRGSENGWLVALRCKVRSIRERSRIPYAAKVLAMES